MSKKTVKKKKAAPAGTIARWGTIAYWQISDKKITALGDLSMSRDWVAKSTQKTDKYKVTTLAHKSAIEFDFPFELRKELAPELDLSDEIKKWNERVGKTAAFYIGKKALATAKKYRLVEVRISDVEQRLGTITACTITLRFKMIGLKVKKKRKKLKTSKKSGKKKSKKK